MSAPLRPNRSRSASSFWRLQRCSCRCTSCTRSGWPDSSALTSIAFSLFGFIVGIWAKSFEQLAIFPALVVTPLTFLGGAFYSIDMLPPFWRSASLFNPVVYLVSGFRWSFYGSGDVSVVGSLAFTIVFIAACLGVFGECFRPAIGSSPESAQLRDWIQESSFACLGGVAIA